jgi:hypothetical protein
MNPSECRALLDTADVSQLAQAWEKAVPQQQDQTPADV